MAINPHHTVEDLNGVRCSIVEKKISIERAGFLENLLKKNGYTVLVSPDGEGTFILGVTDILFNPKYILYSRKLRTPDGAVVTPSFWNQLSQKGEFYWEY